MGAEQAGLQLSSEENAILEGLLGKSHLGLGEYGQALEAFQKALDIDTTRGARRSTILSDTENLDRAQRFVDLALNLFLDHDGPHGFWYGRALTVLAKLQHAKKNMELAEQTLTQALRILEPQIGPEHPLRARLMRHLERIAEENGAEFNSKNIAAEIAEIEKHLRQHDV